MRANILKPTVLAFSMLFVASTAATLAPAQQPATPYPAMAPLDGYLMPDPNAEIALAKSAAPAALSDEAEILVLGRDGYHTAIPGKNGFTCVVERGWMSPLDAPDFWNPKLRGPVCYNPPAVRTILPYTILRTKLILSGKSKEQMAQTIQASLTAGQLPPPEEGAMSYMMSKDGYLGDGPGHWHPHLMFHMPRMAATVWGANLPGSPVLLYTGAIEGPEPETIFLVPIDHWSDGSPAHEASETHQH
jgi:hypothetical protein